MHYVCKNNTPLDIIEKMINSNGKLLELRDSHGWYPLHYACHFGANEDVIKVLILYVRKSLREKIPREEIHCILQSGINAKVSHLLYPFLLY